MTKQDLVENGYDDVVVFENPSYDGCVIGVITDDIVIYSYSRMVEWYCENNKCSKEDAIDFIEYNTLRSLPYQEKHPLVLNDL